MKRILAAMVMIIALSTGTLGAASEKEVLSLELEKDKPSITGIYQTIYKNEHYFGKPKPKHFKVVIENKGENDISFSLVNEISDDNWSKDMAHGIIKGNKTKTFYFSITSPQHALNLTLSRSGEKEGYAVGKIYTQDIGIDGNRKRLIEFKNSIHQTLLRAGYCEGHDKDEDYLKCIRCVTAELLAE